LRISRARVLGREFNDKYFEGDDARTQRGEISCARQTRRRSSNDFHIRSDRTSSTDMRSGASQSSAIPNDQSCLGRAGFGAGYRSKSGESVGTDRKFGQSVVGFEQRYRYFDSLQRSRRTANPGRDRRGSARRPGPLESDGIVSNASTGFQLVFGLPSTAARFIFVTDDGTISGWNPSVDGPTRS
jgi:hypothetical protein